MLRTSSRSSTSVESLEAAISCLPASNQALEGKRLDEGFLGVPSQLVVHQQAGKL